MKSRKDLWKGRRGQSAASWKTRRELMESGGEYTVDVEAQECGNGGWGEGICSKYHSTENRSALRSYSVSSPSKAS